MGNTIDQDIKSGTFKPVYLICGEEEFLKQSMKRRLREAVVGKDTMNFNRFSGKGAEEKEIISLADTMPFFAAHRMILVEDSGFFKKPPALLTEYLPKMPETTVLVFVESQVDRKTRFYKKVREIGRVEEMTRQKEGDLLVWAAACFKRAGFGITRATAEEFLARTGGDMSNIRSEIDKLVSYCAGQKAVNMEDVLAVTTVTTETKIYDLVDKIAAGRTDDAMRLYHDMLSMKIEPMYILAAVSRQFNQLLGYKDMTAAGKDRSSIIAALRIPPFAIRKLAGQAGAYSREQLLKKVKGCVDLEEAVKTGRLDARLAAELLLAGK